MRILHIDFETSSQVDIKNTGVHRYIADETTNIICCAYAFDDEPVKSVLFDVLPNEVAKHINDGLPVYAHNATMEREAIRKFWGLEPNMRCTAAVACYNALPSSLKAVSEYLNRGEKKDMDGANTLKKYYKVDPYEIPKADLEAILAYCEQDVEVERMVHRSLGELPESELRVWKLDQKMNDRGIRVDVRLAQNAIEIVEESALNLNDRILELSDGAIERPTQAARIIKWLNERGIEIDNMRKETVAELRRQELTPEVDEMLWIRQEGGGTAIGKYKKALAMVGAGRRVRGSLRYHGASTGRWAGDGLQPQNLPRGVVNDTDSLAEMLLAKDVKAIEEVAGNVFDGAKSAIRPLLTATLGYKLVVADYSSIEARVLAWIAGQDDLVAQFHTGEDIYCSFASSIFGKPITKADKTERMVGKVGILGLGYGMGAERFKNTLKDWCGLEVKLSFAKKVVDTYRSTYPNIRGYWYQLEAGAIEAMKHGESLDGKWYLGNRNLQFILPSGRIIRYQRPKLVVGKFGNDAISYLRPKDGRLVYSDTYGGKLTENVVQAVARDIMASAMLRADHAGIRLLLSVHDEIIAEARAGEADSTLKQLEAIMTKEISWCRGMPLAVEGFTNFRFKK